MNIDIVKTDKSNSSIDKATAVMDLFKMKKWNDHNVKRKVNRSNQLNRRARFLQRQMNETDSDDLLDAYAEAYEDVYWSGEFVPGYGDDDYTWRDYADMVIMTDMFDKCFN